MMDIDIRRRLVHGGGIVMVGDGRGRWSLGLGGSDTGQTGTSTGRSGRTGSR